MTGKAAGAVIAGERGLYFAVAGLLAAAGAIYLATGVNFFKFTNLLNIARGFSMLSIAALGQTLVIIGGGLDLSVAEVISTANVFAATFMAGRNELFLPITALTLAFGALVGLFNGLLITRRQVPIEGLFEEMIAAAPSVAAGLAPATRVTPVYSTANFSYRTGPIVGDRFVVIGDAVTFVDPIFSTGVYVAMQSAELASRVIVRQFRRGQFRAADFDDYRRRIARGTELFFRLIDRYYEPAFLEVLLTPRPPAMLRDAVTTVLAGGAFLRRPLWLRLRLAVVFLVAALERRRRLGRGLPVESRLSW